MASSLGVFFVLLFGHFLGDYVFQTRWQSLHKRDSLEALFRHVFTYAATITAAFVVGVTTMQVAVPFLLYSAAVFFVVMFLAHGLVDFIATRVYSRLWERSQFKAFFSVVGFEQMLHQYLLLAATIWLVG
jgi:hypothetical protein